MHIVFRQGCGDVDVRGKRFEVLLCTLTTRDLRFPGGGFDMDAEEPITDGLGCREFDSLR